MSPKWEAISDFEAIPELKSDTADLILLMVGKNLIKYGSRVNDPFYAAHQSFLRDDAMPSEKPQYFSDWPNSSMGCRQQVRPRFLAAGKTLICRTVPILHRTRQWNRLLYRSLGPSR